MPNKLGLRRRGETPNYRKAGPPSGPKESAVGEIPTRRVASALELIEAEIDGSPQ